ncbi:uncharacterized protein Z520_03171 [Fonsecaea multimorphosa CBS 102226]|uniref:Uncharacterized protein n=1 Tax=Fonsecaea multimorphosa CBS 102226 TaxID=1442371 RepID=A0A0D2KXR1_9EURO|nr:uncharacterized protein Z520_03171 [Fonsecaea multimorphosa CBS 102226]KIY01619.1 hypothetical protein Z520_03171 [Fonsecaea multimorphosa CBS 102226]OAL23092.1 hypothetical protein AYO22_06585 [Fonsecaea multimorphosa]
MSSNTTKSIFKSETKSIFNPGETPIIKTEETLLQRIFRRKSSTKGSVDLLSDAASMTSTAPLVRPSDSASIRPSAPLRTTSNEEQASFNSLMDKARTMNPDEFKAYLRQYKEDVETMYRRQGGGVTGGDWIYRDPHILGPL